MHRNVTRARVVLEAIENHPPSRIGQANIERDGVGLKLLREMDGPLEKFGREMLRHVGQEKLKQLIELLELMRRGRTFHRREAESAE